MSQPSRKISENPIKVASWISVIVTVLGAQRYRDKSGENASNAFSVNTGATCLKKDTCGVVVSESRK